MKEKQLKLFNFVTHNLGFLKNIPFLPQLFEAFLLQMNALFNPGLGMILDSIEETVLSWENVHLSPHKLGGRQFNYGKKEIGHMHGNGLVDIHLDRRTKTGLISKGVVENHHILKKSGWVSIYVKNSEDAVKVISVLKIAWLRCNRLIEERDGTT